MDFFVFSAIAILASTYIVRAMEREYKKTNGILVRLRTELENEERQENC